MQAQELGKALSKIYQSESDYNYTAARVISYLLDGHIDLAANEFQKDYDKIPGYRRWGRAFKDLGVKHLVQPSQPTPEQELASMILKKRFGSKV